MSLKANIHFSFLMCVLTDLDLKFLPVLFISAAGSSGYAMFLLFQKMNICYLSFPDSNSGRLNKFQPEGLCNSSLQLSSAAMYNS